MPRAAAAVPPELLLDPLLLLEVPPLELPPLLELLPEPAPLLVPLEPPLLLELLLVLPPLVLPPLELLLLELLLLELLLLPLELLLVLPPLLLPLEVSTPEPVLFEVPALVLLQPAKASVAASAHTRSRFVVRITWIISLPISVATIESIDTGVIAKAHIVSESIRSRMATSDQREQREA